MSPPHILQIEWLDSCTTHGWQEPERLSPHPATIQSIGFVVRETKTSVTITTSYSEGGRFCDVLCIPRRAIVKMRGFAAGREKKK